jgi:hypothetical protein
MNDRPATAYIGKYLFFYTPLFPKEPQFISLIPARVVSAKADRQMFIEPAITGESLGKTFTRVGDHIAKVCNSKDECESFLGKLKQYHTQLSAMNQQLMAAPAPAQVRVRTAVTA